MTKDICIVTGANRGLGRGIAREMGRQGFHVVLTGRNVDELDTAVKECRAESLSAEAFYCDVTDSGSIEKLALHMEAQHGKLDALINNAGVLPDRMYQPLPEVPADSLLLAYNTNAVGAYRMMIRLMPLLQKSPMARIVNVSSGAGQLTHMQGRLPAYRASKAALNALTRLVAAEYGSEKLKINAVCPGWVKTAMGGSRAQLTVEEGAAGVVWAATLGPEGPSGGFFRARERLEW